MLLAVAFFSKAELRWAEQQKALNQNNPSSAFLDCTKLTSEAKTDSVAAGMPCAQSSIVLQQPNQAVSSSEQTHTNRHTQERLGVFIAHLSSYRVICGCRLFKHLASSHCNTHHIHVYIQSQGLNGLLSLNHNFVQLSTLHKIIISKKARILWKQHQARKVELQIWKKPPGWFMARTSRNYSVWRTFARYLLNRHSCLWKVYNIMSMTPATVKQNILTNGKKLKLLKKKKKRLVF